MYIFCEKLVVSHRNFVFLQQILRELIMSEIKIVANDKDYTSRVSKAEYDRCQSLVNHWASGMQRSPNIN